MPALSVADASQDDWRKMSRTARYKVDENDYQGAVDLYERAISTIRRTDPKSAYVYDLIISLAETHLIAGANDLAQKHLESIEHVVLNTKFNDPLLAVRFLRRKARLDLITGHQDRALDESTKALNILGQYFAHSGEHYQGQLRKLIEQMWTNKSWKRMAGTVGMLKKTGVNLDGFCNFIELAGRTALKTSDLESAGKLLTSASNLCEDDSKRFALIGLWNAWSDRCYQTHRLDLSPMAETGVMTLSTGYKNPSMRARAKMFAHYVLAAIQQRRGAHERSIQEWKTVRRLFTETSETIGLEYQLLATANITIATDYLKNGVNLDEAEQLTEEVVKLSVLPAKTSKLGTWAHYNWYYCISRFTLARAYYKKGEYARALAQLETIDKGALAKFPGLIKRLKAFSDGVVKEMHQEGAGVTP